MFPEREKGCLNDKILCYKVLNEDVLLQNWSLRIVRPLHEVLCWIFNQHNDKFTLHTFCKTLLYNNWTMFLISASKY